MVSLALRSSNSRIAIFSSLTRSPSSEYRENSSDSNVWTELDRDNWEGWCGLVEGINNLLCWTEIVGKAGVV